MREGIIDRGRVLTNGCQADQIGLLAFAQGTDPILEPEHLGPAPGCQLDHHPRRHRCRVVAKALEVNQPDPDDPIDVLAKVGGFEIGGIAGVILGACANKVPVVVDGFISSAAALLAIHFHPEVKQYLFGGHLSAVNGHRQMLEALGLVPLVNLGMRLGEGTGAAFGLSVLVAASRVATEMLSFEEAAISGPDTY